MSGSGIGMMDPAFFVGRKAILDWLNETFHYNLGKVEETASGSVACQILDMVFPGEVPMSKVRWDAKSPHEFVENYKIVQRVFEKKGVDKHIDVEKLVRGKHQDNLEMMQWFKSFWERNVDRAAAAEYDPLARRAKGRGADTVPAFTTHGTVAPAGGGGTGGAGATAGSGGRLSAAAAAAAAAGGSDEEGGPVAGSRGVSAAGGSTGVGASGAARRPGAPGAPGAAAAPGAAGGVRRPGGTGAAATTAAAPGARTGAVAAVGGRAAVAGHSPAGHGGGAPSSTLAHQLSLANEKIAEMGAYEEELRASVASLERERDFYFGKLRDIEILMQTYTGADTGMVDKVLKIMYATDDDFTAVDEHGNPLPAAAAGGEGDGHKAGDA